MNPQELDRGQQCLTFVSGALDWMVAHRLLLGKGPLTPKGLALFDQLEASGYRPSEQDAFNALLALMATGIIAMPVDQARRVAEVIGRWDWLKAQVSWREGK